MTCIAAAGMLAIDGVGIGRLAFHRKDDVVGNHGGVQSQALAFACQGEDAVVTGQRLDHGGPLQLPELGLTALDEDLGHCGPGCARDLGVGVPGWLAEQPAQLDGDGSDLGSRGSDQDDGGSAT
jgi:hypothetical protein